MQSRAAAPWDVLCLSHLRWDFVYQRPQHLLSRCARQHRVFFVEEPLFVDVQFPQLRLSRGAASLTVVTPLLPKTLAGHRNDDVLRQLLDDCIATFEMRRYALWYYTPMALPLTRHLRPELCIYDCMDELSLFKGAPKELPALEAELFERVDLVFTGGRSLYENKRRRHSNIHLFPSAVEVDHFLNAGRNAPDPADQSAISHPRIGFYGVLDERLDVALVGAVARMRRDWQFVLVGPIAKIDPDSLPRESNIHYLGQKSYATLPGYLANWDIAMLPFALGDATRFISPTKTLEYLAAGKPVISTPLADVVEPYGRRGWVDVVEDAQGFVESAQRILLEPAPVAPREEVRRFLASMSWDRTWHRMHDLMQGCIAQPAAAAAAK